MGKTVCIYKLKESCSRKLAKALSAAMILLILICWGFPGSVFSYELKLPESILGMEKTGVLKGEKASEQVDRMHHGQVTTGSDYIAEYSDDEHSATYYVSLYDEPEDAIKVMQDMAKKMEKTSHEFSHFMLRKVNEHTVYMALGNEQAHYFFAHGKELVWLAVDIAVAEDALEEVTEFD